MSKIITPNQESIQEAIRTLRKGGLVALPTETVYGLAADASNPEAIKKIFTAKQRPLGHPLIVHLGDVNQLIKWAIDIPDSAYQLASLFWPGPLTLILKKHPDVSPIITGNQDTIGIRIPSHPVTLAILREGQLAVAAPSANRHCHVSPTIAADVLEELGDQVDLIIDGGPCAVGLESTILNLISAQPEILRPGMITAAQLTEALHTPVAIKEGDSRIRVSGSLKKHYSPQKPVFLLDQADDIELIALRHKKAAVMALTPSPTNWTGEWEVMPANPEDYARLVYGILRKLDRTDADVIFIIIPPTTPSWDAIHDRLKRASTKN